MILYPRSSSSHGEGGGKGHCRRFGAIHIKYVHFQQGRLSAIHGRIATFLIEVEITLRWHLWWFLTLFGSNKSLPLPPVPLIWTPMDLIDLEHAVGGLLKLWEAHKVL